MVTRCAASACRITRPMSSACGCRAAMCTTRVASSCGCRGRRSAPCAARARYWRCQGIARRAASGVGRLVMAPRNRAPPPQRRRTLRPSPSRLRRSRRSAWALSTSDTPIGRRRARRLGRRQTPGSASRSASPRPHLPRRRGRRVAARRRRPQVMSSPSLPWSSAEPRRQRRRARARSRADPARRPRRGPPPRPVAEVNSARRTQGRRPCQSVCPTVAGSACDEARSAYVLGWAVQGWTHTAAG
mmetsp:Transcript_92880/g.267205  ORF Transcript_92880/g.267205 Transcript_92880/m.267205 type:complete len:244 (-) Transcript_92880:233-964(-)